MNVNRIDHIELSFENCDELVIPAADLYFIRASGLTETWRFGANHALSAEREARTFRLVVPNRIAYDRLTQHPDIVEVTVKQNSGLSDSFYVRYSEVLGGDNEYQTTETTLDEITVVVAPQPAYTDV